MNIIKRPSHGFTLVEIMVVVVVIALLAAMAVPAFNKVRETSQGKACVNNLRQIAYAQDQYFLENGGAAEVALANLIAPDGYIKAMPICPIGGDYPGSLQPGTTPTCDSGHPDHALP